MPCAFPVNQCLNWAGARRSGAPEVFGSRSGAPVLLSRSKAEHRCKTVSHNLYCVGEAIKPCSINQSNTQETTIALLNGTIYHRWPSATFPSQTYLVPNAPSWCRISNGHISSKGHPIHIMSCSRLRFSGSADRMALFLIRSTPRWWLWHDITWLDLTWCRDTRYRQMLNDVTFAEILWPLFTYIIMVLTFSVWIFQ